MAENFQQSDVVQPLLTDLYQISMAYGYWKSNKINDKGAFEFFFRKNPFQGEFTIFAGLEECLIFLKNFRYTEDDLSYLKKIMPVDVEDEFFEFLKRLSSEDIKVYAIDEGSVVFPQEPLIRIEGPLIVGQLLETTVLNLINYASLMATNAARFRMVAGKRKLYEFGLRRAQGPDGGLSASKYSYIGGFDGTSNVLAGKRYNIPVKGTHGHSYILAFTSPLELRVKHLKPQNGGDEKDLLELSMTFRENLKDIIKVHLGSSNDGELAAYVSFAIAFPNNFNALVDTYDVIKSGLVNFCAVALGLNELGYRATGVRIDSGDLAYLSQVARDYFTQISKYYSLDWFKNITIMVSNDINEETILSLNEQGNSIDSFGIGTHLVTCQKQPALGCVCKLVEINDIPRMKLSQEVSKLTIPGRKEVYRLYSENKDALIDIMQRCGERPPSVGEKVLCRHPFIECKRAYVRPQHVVKLHKLYWSDGNISQPLPSLDEIREKVRHDLRSLRADIKRALNPTPYKVSVSDQLYSFLHTLWLQTASIGELY